MPRLPPAIETLHTRIKDSEILAPEEKDALLKFSSELGVHNYSVGRWSKLLQHCTMMAGDSEKYDPDDLPEPDLVDIIGDSKKAKNNAKKYVAGSTGTTKAKSRSATIESHSGCSADT